jgi:hypothetical protein
MMYSLCLKDNAQMLFKIIADCQLFAGYGEESVEARG